MFVCQSPFLEKLFAKILYALNVVYGEKQADKIFKKLIETLQKTKKKLIEMKLPHLFYSLRPVPIRLQYRHY